MKLGKYTLGLALVAAGLTSCDQENIGAIYEPTVANISFINGSQSTLTDQTSIEVPVAIGRATTNGSYTATVTLSDASEGVSLKSNQVTFADGEGMAYAIVVVTGMQQGNEYEGTLTLSDNDVATANTEFGEQITSTTVKVMCDYNWISAGTCTFTDYTWEDGYVAENVPIINGEGSNVYRIVSPLARVYDSNYVDGRGDSSDWQFYLNSDGSITCDEGASLNYWGYYMYFTNDYPSYCFIAQNGNLYDVNFLLLSGSSLYTGGRFTFEWNK
ncbi:MAG: hypothetical protein IKX56_05430 [Muribaculaceae bacterium]|nr:hypothetical protein [Muribaculaceae bacterium]